MTRKCALCKATNYKQNNSFFSAPKDPDMRKKWQTSISSSDVIVNAGTFICSKHFRKSDIITHWISGIPPNAIEIELKKHRLRPGALPICKESSIDCISKVADTTFATRIISNKEIREQLDIERVQIDQRPCRLQREYSPQPRSLVRTEQMDNSSFCTNKVVGMPRVSGVYKSKNPETSTCINRFNKGTEYTYVNELFIRHGNNISSSVESQNGYRFVNCVDYKEDEVVTDQYKNTVGKTRIQLQNVQDTNLKDAFGITSENNDNADIDEHSVNHQHERARLRQQSCAELISKVGNEQIGPSNDKLSTHDTMLFEDLLEIYPEVTLPRGWTFIVTSKADTMTIVYLYMSISRTQIPVVEKEVFVKSDMMMHCVIGSNEINPFQYNLLKRNKDGRIRALSDLEELIEELDQQNICHGGPAIKNVDNVVNPNAYIEGTKWRHNDCPIIINVDSAKCPKCISLEKTLYHRSHLRKARNSNLQNAVRILRMTVIKLSKRNKKLEEIRLNFRKRFRLLLTNGQNTFRETINSSNLPEIQKLMIEECFKASTAKDLTDVDHSQAWIFLSLLLYVESTRMYKYMLCNNYLPLPSMRTIKRYLRQVKTDPEFFNLFQGIVEPYQTVGEADGVHPM